MHNECLLLKRWPADTSDYDNKALLQRLILQYILNNFWRNAKFSQTN